MFINKRITAFCRVVIITTLTTVIGLILYFSVYYYFCVNDELINPRLNEITIDAVNTELFRGVPDKTLLFSIFSISIDGSSPVFASSFKKAKLINISTNKKHILVIRRNGFRSQYFDDFGLCPSQHHRLFYNARHGHWSLEGTVGKVPHSHQSCANYCSMHFDD